MVCWDSHLSMNSAFQEGLTTVIVVYRTVRVSGILCARCMRLVVGYKSLGVQRLTSAEFSQCDNIVRTRGSMSCLVE